MSEAKRKRVARQNPTQDEPVFSPSESPAAAEPVFVSADPEPSRSPFDEPVFDAVPAQARGVTLPVDAPRVDMSWETPRITVPDEPNERGDANDGVTPVSRRLGRTGPVWVGLAAVVLLLLLLIWFFQRNADPGESALPTAPAAGVVGSAQMVDAGATPSPEATPEPATAQPAVRLAPGAEVVVANTNGQGIRLRAAPGTNSQTLGIYNDGAPFIVLTPGGDYSDYPVEANGYFWYRIRVLQDPADQLVGWAVGDFLVRNEQ